MRTSVLNKHARYKQYLTALTKGRLEKRPMDIITRYRMMTDNYVKHLEAGVIKAQTKCRTAFEKQVALLDSLSPLKTMARGYSVATNESGKLVNKTGDVKSR